MQSVLNYIAAFDEFRQLIVERLKQPAVTLFVSDVTYKHSILRTEIRDFAI